MDSKVNMYVLAVIHYWDTIVNQNYFKEDNHDMKFSYHPTPICNVEGDTLEIKQKGIPRLLAVEKESFASFLAS